ncbi:hypothetical protein TCAL_14307 [Tigriopus californicus]|uniref:Serine/threonine-protein phosphatase 2A regulatory subunit B'' subunit gamma n=1 Tax=Tigriopus californicus TaxID=6832 RepID=A0A553NFK2_TIGCA|nr:hypothetical protein TCAL_14307 [Tigriopus californicus]
MSGLSTLKARLKAGIAHAQSLNPDPPARSEDEEFQEIYCRMKGISLNSPGPAAPAVPVFFHSVPSEDDALRLKLREEARAEFLQRRSKSLLDNEELKGLWTLLDANATPTPKELPGPVSMATGSGVVESEQMIGYEAFQKVAKLAGPKCQPFFSPVVFAKLLHQDPHGRISVMAFFNYVMRKVWLHQTRIGLSLYDVTGQGFLREQDLENYIAELIPTLPQLDGLEKSFHNFYTCTAVRKFFFFLDPLRTGRIRIQDILACSFLDELLELRDQDLAKDVQESNCELLKYGTGTLTPVFIERVFQECLTYEGEMDYKTYLDFVLALENRKEPQSLQYFFRILDVRHAGFITAFNLNFFFRDILQEMEKHNQELVQFEDVKDEIFDMVRPKDPFKITHQDLVQCGNGDTVISILIDLNGFWTYENREVLVTDTPDESSAEV